MKVPQKTDAELCLHMGHFRASASVTLLASQTTAPADILRLFPDHAQASPQHHEIAPGTGFKSFDYDKNSMQILKASHGKLIKFIQILDAAECSRNIGESHQSGATAVHGRDTYENKKKERATHGKTTV